MRISSEEKNDAQQKYLAVIKGGGTKQDAYRASSRTVRTVEGWMAEEPFRESLNDAMKFAVRMKGGGKLGFVEFREMVLGRVTFPHMAQWADWMETDDNDHIMILCPPESAKTSFVLDYILWRIYMDPE